MGSAVHIDPQEMAAYLEAWERARASGQGLEWHCTTNHTIRPCGRCIPCRDDARAFARTPM